MRRFYDKTVSLSDGSSVKTFPSGELSSPAQTPIPSPNQANEPERMEIAG